MKRTLIVVALFLTLFAPDAGADSTTLQATGGGIIGNLVDLSGSVRGEGFQVAFFCNPFNTPDLLTGNAGIAICQGGADVNGISYDYHHITGGFAFTYEAIPWLQQEWIYGPAPSPITEPFSMTGGVTLTGDRTTFTVFGQGQLYASYVPADPGSPLSWLRIEYQFAPVPEPFSFVLLCTGLVGLCRRRR